MKEMTAFKNFGIKSGGEVLATNSQIEELYEVPKITLHDNIKKLKQDGLVNGSKIRTLAKDGKRRQLEVYTLEETIAIGLRLRSDTAIRLQRYATKLVSDKIVGLEEEKRLLEIELSYAWNKSDTEDLYR
ncbi:hypothetical protein M3P19_00845 [Muricauda sp. 2012CJ35-5]|uniref:Uncharacterized protein n=1 Tax=Flagellimonas spongiicola TaxID=2942208 RepID=A0ABT0PMC8_9FLAO|nr:hypothetical protein [Allomuricauda spongiicola]MCL6272532.1 hypothetical protein [Allomuricauda spongiicola]